jgi:apoptosis-inducing factor 2
MKNIVIIGGGFAGITCAMKLSENTQFDVTLIDIKDYFEVTFAQLAALTEPKNIGEKSRFLYKSFFKAKFIQDSVRSISQDSVEFQNNSSVKFDVLIIATGSNYRSFPIAKPSEQFVLQDRNLFFDSENAKLMAAQSITIIGGGPVGVELAGEISTNYPDKKITLIDSNNRLLVSLNEKASKIVSRQLESNRVRIVLNEKVSQVNEHIYKSSITGSLYEADIFYNCIGSKPNTDFMKTGFSDSLDKHGLIVVDNFFKVKDTENIYAIGDCNNIPEAKLGYLAGVQGELLAKNIINAASDKKPVSYKIKKTMALIPIGREKGVVQLPFGVFDFRFLIKMKTKDFFISKFLKQFGL